MALNFLGVSKSMWNALYGYVGKMLWFWLIQVVHGIFIYHFNLKIMKHLQNFLHWKFITNLQEMKNKNFEIVKLNLSLKLHEICKLFWLTCTFVEAGRKEDLKNSLNVKWLNTHLISLSRINYLLKCFFENTKTCFRNKTVYWQANFFLLDR